MVTRRSPDKGWTRARYATLEDVLSAGTDRSGSCWLWTKAKNKSGYGVFTWHWKLHRAHCVSYELAHGPIPPGMVICHRCDVRNCVNPAHLFLGTKADNNRDRDEKGRGNIGARNGHAKLSDDAVRELRRRYAAGGVTHAMLAAEYGVTRESVRDAVNRRCWAHVAESVHYLHASSDMATASPETRA